MFQSIKPFLTIAAIAALALATVAAGDASARPARGGKPPSTSAQTPRLSTSAQPIPYGFGPGTRATGPQLPVEIGVGGRVLQKIF